VRREATQTILFVGSGDLASRTTSALTQPARCIGLCRHPDRLPAGFEGVAGDYTRGEAFATLAALAPDVVVLTLKPDGREAGAYRRGFLAPVQQLLAALGDHRPRRLLFVSSTRVYSESDGDWVDESAPVATDDSPAGMIAAAEQALLDSGHPTTLLRCAGLYGGAGGMLLERIARGELSPAQPIHYANRIHRDDAAGFIAWLIEREQSGHAPLACYNLVDDHPAPQHEVDRWLATAMRVAIPDSAAKAGSGASRGHKRVRNERLRASGYALQYPDYRSGYAAALALRGDPVASC